MGRSSVYVALRRVGGLPLFGAKPEERRLKPEERTVLESRRDFVSRETVPIVALKYAGRS